MRAMKWKSALMGGLMLIPLVLEAQDAKPAAAVTKEPPAEVASPEFAPEDTDAPPFAQDPFAAAAGAESAPKLPLARGAEPRTTLKVRMETWEIPAKELAAKLDATHGSDALETWRGELLANDASVLVHSPVVVVDEKSRASSDSILERIYPTEYEPPEPLTVVPEAKGKQTPQSLADVVENILAHATPTSFETRNTGASVEVGVQPVTADPLSWDLSLSLEETRLVAMESLGAEALGIREPAISSFRTGGLLRVKEGAWQILSAQEPPRGIDGKPTGKSWLTMVRVDRVR